MRKYAQVLASMVAHLFSFRLSGVLLSCPSNGISEMVSVGASGDCPTWNRDSQEDRSHLAGLKSEICSSLILRIIVMSSGGASGKCQKSQRSEGGRKVKHWQLAKTMKRICDGAAMDQHCYL
jgi:hypothetical protein